MPNNTQQDAIKEAINWFLLPLSDRVEGAYRVGNYEQKIKNAITCSLWLANTLFKGIAEVSCVEGSDWRHGQVAIAVGPKMENGKPVKASTANALRGVVYYWQLADIPETDDPSIVMRLTPHYTFIGRSIKSRPIVLSLDRGILHSVAKSGDSTYTVTRLSDITWHGGHKVLGDFQHDHDFPLAWCQVFDPYVHGNDLIADTEEASVLVPISAEETLRINLTK